SLASIGVSFRLAAPAAGRGLAAEAAEGLRYVIGHPVLRLISLMMAINNFFCLTIFAQIVLYAGGTLGYSRQGIGVLLAAGGVGVVVAAWLAGRLRARFPFATVMLGGLVAWGAAIILLALAPRSWAAVAIWAAVAGAPTIFNSCAAYLRQR